MTPIYQLAMAFSEELIALFSPLEIQVINSRNVTPEYKNCCATHDFCDANMVMEAAFQRIFGREPNLHVDNDILLWNKGWGIAKRNQFNKLMIETASASHDRNNLIKLHNQLEKMLDESYWRILERWYNDSGLLNDKLID